nr:MAG TPA: hypothetical protein [Bacteriophage sp.]
MTSLFPNFFKNPATFLFFCSLSLLFRFLCAKI